MGWNESREEPVTKKIRLFDQEVGFYTLEIQNEKLEGFPHLLNEAYVLGLSILQEENDDTWALGLVASTSSIQESLPSSRLPRPPPNLRKMTSCSATPISRRKIRSKDSFGSLVARTRARSKRQ